ncbi:Holliday junction resolvase [Porphyromonas crevioricanis]|uniref:Putative pre-16S rRNA nuclease n=2 Tax=Porphyromonas crevioricanis TaxID=393921 RepID=A0A0A2FIR1_9PORP|nr:Holliday junction resolvase RuvX [Porphyromonas crevioricanis]KGN90971.1 Holliday junction resolvase [Porphyromonas crevioricanis]KGN95067.1 Holliday junction resolvase [Porphyromonas crevioricanis]SJZ54823.1 putative holliday junction resolvase [Porphyromonas crevioricanis]SQH73300.1 Putative Holliday junction resolvase [Porphyromonas crevioricanis]GAD06288.1 holliday junction resolvase-like protein [Porphyromonas crevioricanis JCM 15906]
MGRILAIDYGLKRCGIAVTDVLGMIPGGLCTVATYTLEKFLSDYIAKEPIDLILVGYPRQMNGQESESMAKIRPFVEKLKKKYPDIPVEYEDERFTSVLAQRSIIEAGIPKMKRRNKGLVDEVSAVIILQSYLERKDYRSSF